MTREENVLLAKKFIKDTVYSQILLEYPNMTFLDTEVILDRGNINNISVGQVEKVLNLKRAWNHILKAKDSINLETIKKIHYVLAYEEALDFGSLRSGNVAVSGTDFKPTIPVASKVEKEINKIMAIKDPYIAAANYVCYAIKNQLFYDGNKRTSLLVANKILIDRGAGILYIDPMNMKEFSKLLKDYYNDESKKKELINFLLYKCLFNTYEKTFDKLAGYIKNTGPAEFKTITIKLTKESKTKLKIKSLDTNKKIMDLLDEYLTNYSSQIDSKIKDKSVTVTTKLNKDLKTKLEKMAVLNNVSVSDIIEDTIKRKL